MKSHKKYKEKVFMLYRKNDNKIQFNKKDVIKIDIISEENKEIPFFVRPYEEVDNGYIDDRGFYTTPNGSFWDEDKTYFNHFGFDQFGGSYDKYGVYHPGEGYDEKLGIFDEEKELFNFQEIIDDNKINNAFISRLKEQEKKDEHILQKYAPPFEESEEVDNENLSFNEDDIKEVFENCLDKPIIQQNNWDEKCYIYDDSDIHDIFYNIEIIGFSENYNIFYQQKIQSFNKTKKDMISFFINGKESNYNFNEDSINFFLNQKISVIHIIYRESFDSNGLSLDEIERYKIYRKIYYGLDKFLYGQNSKFSLILRGNFEIVSFEDYFLRKNKNNKNNIEYFWEGLVPFEGKKTLIALSRNKAKWSFYFLLKYYSKVYLENSFINLPFPLIGGNNEIININISSLQAKNIYIYNFTGEYTVYFKNIRDFSATFIMKGELENKCKAEWKVDLTDEEIDKKIPKEDKLCKKQLKKIAKDIIKNFNEKNKNNDFEFSDYMKIALWVYHNIKYNEKKSGKHKLTAIDIYNLKEGVCHHFTRLSNALLYSLGYKVIYVTGYAFVSNIETNDNHCHAWSIIKINNKWYPFDSTWGIVSGKIPVTHIFSYFGPAFSQSQSIEFISGKLIT